MPGTVDVRNRVEPPAQRLLPAPPPRRRSEWDGCAGVVTVEILDRGVDPDEKGALRGSIERTLGSVCEPMC